MEDLAGIPDPWLQSRPALAAATIWDICLLLLMYLLGFRECEYIIFLLYTHTHMYTLTKVLEA